MNIYIQLFLYNPTMLVVLTQPNNSNRKLSRKQISIFRKYRGHWITEANEITDLLPRSLFCSPSSIIKLPKCISVQRGADLEMQSEYKMILWNLTSSIQRALNSLPGWINHNWLEHRWVKWFVNLANVFPETYLRYAYSKLINMVETLIHVERREI